jgi:lipoyl(octanoyl) transferase
MIDEQGFGMINSEMENSETQSGPLLHLNKSIPIVKWKDLGLLDYKKVWDIQEDHLQRIVSQKISARTNPDIIPEHFLFFTEHPPVFTLGKSGLEKHLLNTQEELETAGIQYYKSNRGGDITFHGPGQIVGYPILDLDQIYTDIHRYLREVEQTIIETLSFFGIMNAGRKEGLTGVWVGEEKICAIGVRASRWVTMHGFALNVNTDLGYFDRIVPCGISDKAVTSMEKILGKEIEMEVVKATIRTCFENIFQVKLQHEV